MGKSSKDTYGALGSSNQLLFDPADLTLVTDKNHPLYDARVELPLDEAMIANIMYQGFIQPIVVTKDPENGLTLVVAGRQRVKNGIEANRRLALMGKDTHRIPAIPRQARNSRDLIGLMASENAIRTDESPTDKAMKIVQAFVHGKDMDEVEVMFGLGKQAVTAYRKLLESPKAIQNAVDSGRITLTSAKALFSLQPDEAKAKLEEMLAAGEGATGHAKARAQKAVIAKGPIMKKKKEIEAEMETSNGARKAALAWVLGVE